MLDFFKRVKRKKFRSLKLPKFNKATDDRYDKKSWYSCNPLLRRRPDVLPEMVQVSGEAGESHQDSFFLVINAVNTAVMIDFGEIP